MKLSREKGLKALEDDEVLLGSNGKPLIQIYCSASEVIPTMNRGTVTCGPVIVKRYVEDDKELKNNIIKTQTACEEALADDRHTAYFMSN